MEPLEEQAVSITVYDYEYEHDSDCESSSPVASGDSNQLFTQFTKIDGVITIDQSEEKIETAYRKIKKSFLEKMGNCSKDHIEVLAIHRNYYTSFGGKLRLKTYKDFSKSVAENRGGDANIKIAWYGGSKEEICDIMSHGFSRLNEFERGVGVSLSPLDFPNESAMTATEDKNGIRHMLLCSVILGNSETIHFGSRQFQPSSSNYDSGIDNPLKPRKYIIWSSYMNSHILPIDIFSFRSPSLAGACIKKPTSPYMRFPILLNVLSIYLDSARMELILNCYNDFRGKRISRPEVVRRFRRLIGDEILTFVIKLCRDKSIHC